MKTKSKKIKSRKQIYRIFDIEDHKVCETADRQELIYYRSIGYKIIATGSYIVRFF